MTPLSLILWCLAVLVGAFTIAVVLATVFILLGLLVQALRRPGSGLEDHNLHSGKPLRLRFREAPPRGPRLVTRLRHGRPRK